MTEISAPSVTERAGRLVVTWPTGRGEALVSPDLIERWATQVNELRAEIERLRGVRLAFVAAIEDGIVALNIDHLSAYDVERIARVVGGVFRIEEPDRG